MWQGLRDQLTELQIRGLSQLVVGQILDLLNAAIYLIEGRKANYQQLNCGFPIMTIQFSISISYQSNSAYALGRNTQRFDSQTSCFGFDFSQIQE